MVSSSDVIQQLNDANTRAMGFPHFEVFFPVDARLSAYREGDDWALILETFVFNPGPSRHSCICTLTYCYGNALPQAPGPYDPPLCVTSDGPSGPTFDATDFVGHFIRNDATDMRARGTVVPITTDRKTYDAANIRIKWPQPPGWARDRKRSEKHSRIHGCELLRLIAPRYRQLFFATEAELAERIGRQMPLLLRLDEWYHADPANHEEPYQSESYQLVAQVIAAKDPALYKPGHPPNTHWRNWPEAGFIY
jgi:hypothetical protein